MMSASLPLAAIAAAASIAVSVVVPAIAQPKPVSMGIVTFLTGAAAGPFGVPARNGAEIVIEAINAGKLPAPYNTAGIGGARIEPVFVDESGGNARQVAEYRNLVEKRGVDVVLGYISSGTCEALTPVVEELKKLTVYALCATPRVYEEADRRYVFRTVAILSSDGITQARYLKDKFPNVKSFSGIHPNYAWGQDSARDFQNAMSQVLPDVKATEVMFPKLFQGAFSTEISALLLDRAELIHSSLWDGDLESFILQGKTRGLFDRKKVVFSVGDTAVYRLGEQLPEGLIIGARGPYGVLVRDRRTPLNDWFIQTYKDRYNQYPTGPSYQYAQAVLATKIAYDKAAMAAGKFPSQDQVIDAFTGLKFESFSTTIELANNKGRQAIHENAIGVTKWDKDKKEVTVTDLKFYPAACVNPPPGQHIEPWVKGGMSGAKC